MIKKKLPDIVNNFSQWYQEVIFEAELAENCDVKGCIIILPYGNAIWENITKILNESIKKMGALNMSFPLLIPYCFFEKEKEHIDGFAPEVAIVTHAGGKKLEEPLVIRPTSEVIIHDFFRKKIKSWRNLPFKVNQWCSVIRWEKRPRPFLRTTEFWWQEGHTAHATYSDALLQAEEAIIMYKDFCKDYLAIPVIMGKKPDYERFAGADITWTIEGMMQDGKAVQMGTAHLLGEGFAKSANIEFQDKDMHIKTPYLTSWGVTTRMIGTLIMVHGDKNGLVFPPYIAPILFYLVPIYKNNIEKERIFTIFDILKKLLDAKSINYFFDDREELTPGAKFFDSEIKGIPFRIEIGIRDIENGVFTLFQRDINKKDNHFISIFDTPDQFYLFIDLHKKAMHERMLLKATMMRDKKILHGNLLSEFGDNLINYNGFYVSYWCGADADRFKEYQCSVRCFYDDINNVDEKIDETNKKFICCLHENTCEIKIRKKVIIARSY